MRQTETSKKPVDRIMSTFVNQPGVPIVDLKNRCSGSSTSVSMDQRRYYSDRKNFEAPNDELWEIPMCMKSSDGSQNCELLGKRQGTASLSGCATWVLGNANAAGYYRVGYQPEAIQALARAAESQLSPAEQIELQSNVWASVRVGREPVGDFLAVAEGLEKNRNRAVMEDLFTRLGYIGRYLVTEATAILTAHGCVPT